jgi:hypothetical protein
VRPIRVLGAGFIVASAIGIASSGASASAAVTCSYPNCEETITPGVKLTTNKGECTAGPVLTNDAKEFFMLTDAHCVTVKEYKTRTEIAGATVQAEYPKGGPPEKNVGNQVWAVYDKTNDTAEVKVNATWAKGGVPGRLANWGATPILDYVAGEAASKVGEFNCQAGFVSKETCGEVLSEDVRSGKKEKLVEDSAEGQPGDSGAPFFIESVLGDEVQGVLLGGATAFAAASGVNVMKGSNKITLKPANADEAKDLEKVIKAAIKRWEKLATVKGTPTGVPVKAVNGLVPPIKEIAGIIPPSTMVKSVKVDKGILEVEMTTDAEATGSYAVAFGRLLVTYYEPISEILKQYPGQKLVTEIEED